MTRRDRLPVRLFAALVRRMLPDALVAEHGEAQVDAFRDLYDAARRHGMTSVLRLFVRELAGLINTARALAREAAVEQDRSGRSTWISDVTRDLRLAGRTLRGSPGYAITVIGILALGIGAIAAVFTVANAVFFRPLPYNDAEDLTIVWSVLDRQTNPSTMTVSPADFLDWRRDASSFQEVAAHNLWFPVLSSGEGDARQILAGLVTPEMFTLLGVAPAMGRTFRADEADGGSRVVMLSHELWVGRYGADPDILGRDVRLDGLPYEVVGVLPSDYRHPDPHRPLLETQLFAPFDMSTWADQEGRYLRVFGRLADGVTLERAQSEMDALALRLEGVRPVANRDVGAAVVSMRDQFYASSRPALYLAIVGAGLLFVIVCANVANLVLARCLARRREFAVRVSLGAGKARIVRQILTENGLLALAGSVVGIGGVVFAMDVLQGLQGRVLPTIGDMRIDGTVAVFVAALIGVTTLLLGVLPLGEFLRTPVRSVLAEEGGGTGASRRSQRIRSALVIGEIAVAAALVVAAGLLSSSFRKLTQVGPGFDVPALLTAEVTAPGDRYESAEAFTPMYEELHSRLAALPGVASAAYASQLPMLDGNWSRAFDVVDDPREESAWPMTEYRLVSPGYFGTMGIPLVAGREFRPGDRAEAPAVLIVNQTLARRHWPDESAVGRLVRWRRADTMVTGEVVGVVGDVLDDGLSAEPEPFTYYPFAQSSNRSAAFVLRTTGDPGALVASVRSTVRDLDSHLPLDPLAPYRARVLETIRPSRLASTMALAFSVLALVIAGLGIYGVVAYAVGARTREIGIRSALGAGRGELASLVLRQSLTLALVGAVVGLGLAVASARVMASLLFETSTLDPLSYLLAPGILVAVALVASWVPTRRAVSVDPVRALRADGR